MKDAGKVASAAKTLSMSINADKDFKIHYHWSNMLCRHNEITINVCREGTLYTLLGNTKKHLSNIKLK